MKKKRGNNYYLLPIIYRIGQHRAKTSYNNLILAKGV